MSSLLLKSAFTSALLFAIAYVGSRWFRRKTGESTDQSSLLLLPFKVHARAFYRGIGLAGVLLSGGIVLGAILSLLNPPPQAAEQVLRRAMAEAATGGAFLSVVLLAPWSEEALFRGFLLPALAARWGERKALHGSALLFAALHLDLFRLPLLYLAAWLLGREALRERNLLSVTVAHSIWNGCNFILLWLSAGGGTA
ncbi:CPBP family intramembrane glutamic endopeptidase [Heliophilum fasciatum]|uniref:CAAX prenyl protease-like protein n=1 Tax=Heliophilum fasciatum TaxID=35700 RepID=A0A4R2RX91_9FIRM|nr:CPBP family intramembrane glutamic endopeptidase [Heliophilum fasciatum]MCW2277252.1 membrane protease YdiL (CAAX protease family) [Heliophilum fasciatum]TCP68114.1 CAAX prenyl protease-like protein [Heliophilum fasciatum]